MPQSAAWHAPLTHRNGDSQALPQAPQLLVDTAALSQNAGTAQPPAGTIRVHGATRRTHAIGTTRRLVTRELEARHAARKRAQQAPNSRAAATATNAEHATRSSTDANAAFCVRLTDRCSTQITSIARSSNVSPTSPLEATRKPPGLRSCRRHVSPLDAITQFETRSFGLQHGCHRTGRTHALR